jgi:hypothetical protein
MVLQNSEKPRGTWGAQLKDQSEPIAIIIGCHFQMLKFDEMTFFFELRTIYVTK